MKITIDTGQDSHTDIKKAIRLLQSIVDNHEVYTNVSRNIFDDSSPTVNQQQSSAPTTAFTNLFDSPAKPEVKEEKEKEFKLELY